MKITTRTHYGIRFLINLALKYNNGLVQIKEIAAKEDISEKYLEQIALKLKQGGFIRSSRGSHGGYALSRKPVEISLKEIYEVLEGPLVLVNRKENKVVANETWKDLEKIIEQFLKLKVWM